MQNATTLTMITDVFKEMIEHEKIYIVYEDSM